MENTKKPTEMIFSFKDGKVSEVDISRNKLNFYSAVKEFIHSLDKLQSESSLELPTIIETMGYEITINKSK